MGPTHANPHQKDGSAVGHRDAHGSGSTRARTRASTSRSLSRYSLTFMNAFAGVTIEQLGYGEFLRRYDRAGMLFYLDPPYWRCEKD